jgi:hypothetical protein
MVYGFGNPGVAGTRWDSVWITIHTGGGLQLDLPYYYGSPAMVGNGYYDSAQRYFTMTFIRLAAFWHDRMRKL